MILVWTLKGYIHRPIKVISIGWMELDSAGWHWALELGGTGLHSDILLPEERLTYGHIFEAVEEIMQPFSLEQDSSLCHRASRRRLLMHGIPRVF
ncbi:hypothetical protein DTO271G3_6497 [Paecilomyces variotii]|nr:hypothetical protein DTO271G3_6497 [Paecilomyces variotii]